MPGSGGGSPDPTGSDPPTPTGGGGGGTGLDDKFSAKGKLFFGTEIDHYHLNNNPLTTIVKNDFGQVTNENSMKWDAIERENPLSRLYFWKLITKQRAAINSLSPTLTPLLTSLNLMANWFAVTP